MGAGGVLSANIGTDQARIDRKTLGANQPLGQAALDVISNNLRSRSLLRNRPCRFFEKVE